MATSNEYSVFRYFLCLTPELITQILAMGENVEVLEPQELRDRVKERAFQIANLYK
jgi:predicted DNA-binding transcriptional regulator YafY